MGFTGTASANFIAGPPFVTASFVTNPSQTLPLSVGSSFTLSGATHPTLNGTFIVNALTTNLSPNDGVQFTVSNPHTGVAVDNNVLLMPSVKCDLNTLNQAGKCWACFSELQAQAALVYFLNQTLATLQSVTPQTPNQLRQTAACINCTRPETVCDNLDVAVAQAGAVAAGVPGAGTISASQVKAASNAFRNMSLSELRSIEIILRCQINAFL